MLSIEFAGWTQCRLATDPDPYDDPRGVSGYLHAYAGEPDLDRIIRFQNPPFRRTMTPDVGVVVRSVVLHGVPQAAHPLIGAAIDLLDRPVFEGRNGVVAEDALEPIVPFHLEIRRGADRLARATVPNDPSLPARFREFNASSFQIDPGFIERATGVADLKSVWSARLAALEAELPDAPVDARPGLEERIEFLRRNLGAGGGAARFFAARLGWEYALRSEVQRTGAGPAGLLDGFHPTSGPWRVNFWFGGWDADAQLFFVGGQLEIDAEGAPPATPMLRRPERMSDVTS